MRNTRRTQASIESGGVYPWISQWQGGFVFRLVAVTGGRFQGILGQHLTFNGVHPENIIDQHFTSNDVVCRTIDPTFHMKSVKQLNY